MSPKHEKKSFWSKLDPFTYVDEYAMPVLNPWKNEYLSWALYIVFSFVFAFALYSIFGFLLQTATPLVIVVSGSMLPTMARGDVVLLQGVDGPTLNVTEVVLDGVDVGNLSLEELAEFHATGNGNWLLTFKENGQQVIVPSKGTSDIVVYTSTHKNLEIIHRAVVKIRADGEYFVLTKGDNNPSLDQDCGSVSQLFVPGSVAEQTFTSKSCPSPYPIPLSQVKGKALVWIPWLGYVKLILVDGFQSFLR